MKSQKRTARYVANIRGMDSRADWLLSPGLGLQDYLPNPDVTLVPFIMNVHDPQAMGIVADLVRRGKIYIPISSPGKPRLRANRSFTAWAAKSFFDELSGKDGELEELRVASKEILLCSPLPSAQPSWRPGGTIPELVEPPIRSCQWPPGTVVIGVIDDGIAFGHEHFRNAGGTRVQFFWRQDGPQQNPPTVEFGSELAKENGNGRLGIDSLLTQSVAGGSVDEESFYRRAGVIDFAEPGARHRAAAWRAAHGTHVLDMAAGAPRQDNVENRPIVCVQLPASAVADPTGALWEDKVKSGIEFILRRADLMSGDGPPLPVVINFSFGTLAGPHDGTSSMERDFDQQIAARPKTRMVLPAGNSHLSRCHATVAFTKPEESVELQWRVQPDDRTPSCLHIWMPHEGATAPSADRIRVSVQSPGGVDSLPLGETNPGTGVEILDDGGETVCTVIYVFEAPHSQRGRYTITLQPTLRLEPVGPVAPPGVWKVKLHNLRLNSDHPVQAWIERDGRVYGYPPRGRQSYFDDPCYVRFDAQGQEIEDDPPNSCPVKRAGLINAIATGHKTIVIGGVLRTEMVPARYSAGGPITVNAGSTNPAHRPGPDALCVSDDSKVHDGVLGAGSRSGSVVWFSGTSVAAPLIAREVARDLETGGGGDQAFVRNLAQSQESGNPQRPPAPSQERGGWGRILVPHPYMKVRRIG